MKSKRVFLVLALALCAGGAGLEANAVESYRKGLHAFEEGDADNTRRAISWFRRAVEENPYYFKAWRSLGLAYHRMEYYRLARPALEKALEQQADHVEANLAYAETMLLLGNAPVARRHIDRVLAQLPRNTRALFVDALWWSKNGRLDLAFDRLRSVLAIAPQYWQAHLLRGQLLAASGQTYAAELAFRAAVTATPHGARARYGLGRFLFDQGRLAEAGRELKTTVELDREFVPALEPLARILFIGGDYPGAADIFARLTEIAPDTAMYRYLLALSQSRMVADDETQIEAARTNYRAALVLRNNDEIIRYAFEDFAVQSLPIRSDERIELARYHLAQGDFYAGRNLRDQAQVSYRRAIRLNPYSTTARGHLARTYRDTARWEKYLDELNLLARVDTGNARLNDSIGYYRTIVERLPSRVRGIRQYDEPSSLSSIVVPDLFEAYDVRHGYYGVDGVIGSMLRDALTPRSGLRLIRLPGHAASDLVTARQKARAAGADYFVHGRYVLERDSVRLEVSLRHAASGEQLAVWTSSRRGNQALYEAAVDIADRIQGAIPLVGRIFRITGDEVAVNLGRAQGIAKGTVLRVFADPSFRNRHLATFGRNMLPKAIGEITVERVDDAVAFGEITAKGTFGGITTYQYVMVKPAEKVAADPGQGGR